MPLISNNIKILSYAVILCLASNVSAQAAQCGNSAGGFESWKQDFLSEAAHNGLSANALDRKSTRLNSSHIPLSRMPSSA